MRTTLPFSHKVHCCHSQKDGKGLKKRVKKICTEKDPCQILGHVLIKIKLFM